MSNKKVTGTLFKKMVKNGAINLKNNHKEIDSLNVFPVPDGDTGTNMQMTMMAGVKEVESVESHSIIDVSKILSRGLLMGARGNSGVILSQFFRGVSSEIGKLKDEAADVSDFIQALVGGYQMAYRAVMDPVEGTILTVVRESAEKVLKEQHNLNTIEDVLKIYLEQAQETLATTPELLPVLKEAGVVDSGGAGFVKIIEGMIMALEGNILLEEDASLDLSSFHALDRNISLVDIKFGYCTEFIVKLNNPEKFDVKNIRDPLAQMGDSLVVATDEDILKVHVHTNQPGVAITLAQKYGDLQTVKVDNMRLQHQNILTNAKTPKKSEQKGKYGIIAVGSGKGIHQTFNELGVDVVIDGGQTMNPSTEDFVKAIEELHVENIIILPNNSNIILAAEQTLDLVQGVNVRVLKTKSVAQGYASLMAFDPTQDLDDNIEEMLTVVKAMRSGEVTYAIRDTEISGVNIKAGDYMGITKGEIVTSNHDRVKTTRKLLDNMINDDTEIITIFYGSDVKESETLILEEYIHSINDDIETEVIDGGQDIYSYIIAVE